MSGYVGLSVDKWGSKMKRSEINALEAIKLFSIEAHHGQTRKYTLEPYINHPIAVSNMVFYMGGNFSMVSAAILHDVVEDTKVEFHGLSEYLKDIRTRYEINTNEIYGLVHELTDKYTKDSYPHLNRKERKSLEAATWVNKSLNAQIIKRCDLYDNSLSIEKHDPEFYILYKEEVESIFNVMSKIGTGDE